MYSFSLTAFSYKVIVEFVGYRGIIDFYFVLLYNYLKVPLQGVDLPMNPELIGIFL